MPDISMCKDKECPVKETCYRYVATPSEYQAYSAYKHTGSKGCDHYWRTNSVKKAK